MDLKVQRLLKRLAEVEEMLAAGDLFSDPKRYKEVSQEHAYLSSVRDLAASLDKGVKELEEGRVLLAAEKEQEMADFLKEDIARLEKEVEKRKKALELLLVPPDPRDNRPIILELRAGTGGDEAALFVSDCARMYLNYAAKKGWKVEVLATAASELHGYKEYIVSIAGPAVFRYLQYEAGTHRVQRVPETETQGRIHTSAITVAILVEPDEEEVVIKDADLRIDTFRSSGAGGQHVNTTDSAVRITHLPTNTVVACQEERSQHKNREKAMRMLRAEIGETIRKQKEAEMSAMRSSQVGSGDRSERIRTYNFPQNRITDHRIGLTLYNLDRAMEGDLDEITEALVSHFYAKKINS